MKYIIFLLFVSQAAKANGYHYEMHGNENYQKLDTFARAMNLHQLRSSDKNELRLWWREPMGGDISALIINEKNIYKCEAKSKYSEINTEIIVSSGVCRKSTNQLESAKLNNYLTALSELEAKDTDCNNVMDGWGITVEGVINKKRFAFHSWNPDACKNPESIKLMNVLEIIEKSNP